MPEGSVGDLFQVVFQQEYRGQTCLNTFTYRQTTENLSVDSNSSFVLAFAFDANVVDALQDIQLDDVSYQTIDVINLYNPLDLWTRTPSPVTTGAVTPVEPLGEYLAIEFRTARVTRAIRRGFKRFTGLDESMLVAGILNPTYFAAVNTLSAEMNAVISNGSITGAPLFEPVIVKRIKYITPAGDEAYRLPETPEEGEYFVATWDYLRISTQSSRKPW